MAPPPHFSVPQTQLYSPEKVGQPAGWLSRAWLEPVPTSWRPWGHRKFSEVWATRERASTVCTHLVGWELEKLAGWKACCALAVSKPVCSDAVWGCVCWGGGVCAMHAFSVHLESEAPVSMLRGMCVRLQSLVGRWNVDCWVNYRPYSFPAG